MNVDEKKMKLIDEFMEMSKGRTSDEILPLILAISQKAKQMGLIFTKDETLMLIENIKKDMSPKDRAKVDMITKMIS
ncbi:MAG: hypothetical protein ACI4GD_08490 [Lachnospiraceae bacterium]